MKPTETDLKPRSKRDFADDSPVEFKLTGYSRSREILFKSPVQKSKTTVLPCAYTISLYSRSREILFKSPVQNSKTTVLPCAYTISLYSTRSSPHTGIAPSAYKQTSSG